MRYYVFRHDTLSGTHYRVVTHSRAGQTNAVWLGELEAHSYRAAAKLLKARLKRGLNESPNFYPAPES